MGEANNRPTNRSRTVGYAIPIRKLAPTWPNGGTSWKQYRPGMTERFTKDNALILLADILVNSRLDAEREYLTVG